MKLSELNQTEELVRPEENKRSISDGMYEGTTAYAELQERECRFSKDGTRVVLSIRVEVEDEDGETVDLYVAPNYSWSKRGHMMQLLESLDALPEPGESIALQDLVGIPVQVLVENVEKNGEVYSNIVRIKKRQVSQEPEESKPLIAKKVVKKKPHDRTSKNTVCDDIEKVANEDSAGLDTVDMKDRE
jgi:hypothetical protein